MSDAHQPGPYATPSWDQGSQPGPYGGGYGPPPPGGGYGYGPPPQRTGTNGFAVAGLVLGILPVLAGILGIVFGAIGLRQIKRSGQDGRGMALAGVILGSIWLVVVAAVIVVAAVTDAGSDDSSRSRSPGTSAPSPGGSSSAGAEEADAFDVQVGDCLVSPPTGEVEEVDVLPCSTPHKVEAYASFRLPGTSYPGDTKVTDSAESGCVSRFAAFVGKAVRSSSLELYYLHPTSESWSIRDDREVLCLVESPTSVTGTLRNSRR